MPPARVGYKRYAAQAGPDPKRPRVTLEAFHRQVTAMLRSACILRAGLLVESDVTHGHGRFDQFRVSVEARFERSGRGRVTVGIGHRTLTFVLHSPYTCDRAGQLLEDALAALL